jgi:hypothetical protein
MVRAGRVAKRVAAGVAFCLTIFLVALAAWRPAANDAPLPVRFPEGVLHGFLVLRTAQGDDLAQGDLLVGVRNGAVESRMVFAFTDGSLHDERVTFTQDSVFRMREYSLEQRGPTFPADVEIALDGNSGHYRVVSRAHESGEREVHEDTLDLPPDTYNGMALTIVKNLPENTSRAIHYVAFTPKPQLIGLEIVPTARDSIRFGDASKTAVHYVLKPRLGLVRQVFATLLGRDPPDNHIWIVTEGVPGFVRFDGPLFLGGPVWRIELATPRWPK